MVYLKSMPGHSSPAPKHGTLPLTTRKLAVCSLLVFISLALCKPFANRYFLHHFWRGPDEIRFENADSTHTKLLGNHSLVALKPGTLVLTVTGAVDVGTYTGLVGPQGTNIGFLGFTLDGLYNRIKGLPHAALLQRTLHGNTSTGWQLPDYRRKRFLAGGSWETRIPVHANDTIPLMINDSEWQNNSGHFTVEAKLLDTTVSK